MANTKPKAAAAKPTRKSKGKRHLVHAESLDLIADKIDGPTLITGTQLAQILRSETDRLRGILR